MNLEWKKSRELRAMLTHASGTLKIQIESILATRHSRSTRKRKRKKRRADPGVKTARAEMLRKRRRETT